MRITNSMISNSTLININRNMRYLDKITQQVQSTKKIGVPSDDPIIASRALKFRTSVAETKQFMRNVKAGISWMEISEAALLDVDDNLLVQLEDVFTEGATGTETYSDKMALITTIKNAMEQMGVDMNHSYAGRYVFSGYRTDEPAVLIEDDAEMSYVITQFFDMDDIERTKSYQKDVTGGNDYDPPIVHDINILKMAYDHVEFGLYAEREDGTGVPLGITKPDGTMYNVVAKNAMDTDAYTPPDDGNTIYYIRDTGELVMGDQAVDAFKDGTEVTYQKKGFLKGELNPLVYFDCKVSEAATGTGYQLVGATASYNSIYPLNSPQMRAILEGCDTGIQDTQYFYFNDPATGSVQPLASFDLGKMLQEEYAANPPAGAPATFNEYVDQMYDAAGNVKNQAEFLNILTGALERGFKPPNTLTPPLQGATPTATVTGGTININFNFDFGSAANPPTFTSISCSLASPQSFGHGFTHNAFANAAVNTPVTVPIIKTTDEYDMDDQEIQYEFATNTYITINSLSKDIYTDNLYADLKRLINFAESLKISDPKDLRAYYSDPNLYTPPLSGTDLDNKVDEQITAETANMNAVLQDRFNNMLGLLETHSSGAVEEHTQMGSRMLRLELLSVRLEEDLYSYDKLKSENEDTDMEYAIMQKANAEYMFQAALQANSKIMQLSLANYI